MSNIEERPIPGHDGYFAASNGDVVSYRQGRRHVLTPNVRERTVTVDVRDDKRPRHLSAARLITAAWHGPATAKQEVFFRDGNHHNLLPSNLYFDRPYTSGTRHHLAKLDERRVIEIIDALSGGETQTAIAGRFGVSRHSIYLIDRGRTWSHVPRPSRPHLSTLKTAA